MLISSSSCSLASTSISEGSVPNSWLMSWSAPASSSRADIDCPSADWMSSAVAITDSMSMPATRRIWSMA